MQVGDTVTLLRTSVTAVVTKIATNFRVGRCRYCGDEFVTGPMTGKRSHRKYCCDAHRVAFMRTKPAVDAIVAEMTRSGSHYVGAGLELDAEFKRMLAAATQ